MRGPSMQPNSPSRMDSGSASSGSALQDRYVLRPMPHPAWCRRLCVPSALTLAEEKALPPAVRLRRAVASGLDQTSANGVADQARGFVNVEFLH